MGWLAAIVVLAAAGMWGHREWQATGEPAYLILLAVPTLVVIGVPLFAVARRAGRREFESYVSGVVTGIITCALIGAGIGSLSARANFGATEGAIAGAVVGLVGGTILAVLSESFTDR